MQTQARICEICKDDHSAQTACTWENLWARVRVLEQEERVAREHLNWIIKAGEGVSIEEHARRAARQFEIMRSSYVAGETDEV